jgi:hypothetical protein
MPQAYWLPSLVPIETADPPVDNRFLLTFQALVQDLLHFLSKIAIAIQL